MTRRGLVLAVMKAGLCLALTACASTPPTPSPPSLPQAFRNLAEAPSGPGGSDWWQAFGDPALNALEAASGGTGGGCGQFARAGLQPKGLACGTIEAWGKWGAGQLFSLLSKVCCAL